MDSIIIAFVEGGNVEIYSDLDEALLEWGKFPSDIASDVVIFYDHEGNWLRPIEEYEQPSWYKRHGKLKIERFEKISSFVKTLEHYQDSLGYLLAYEARNLKPNCHFSSLEDVKKKFPYIK